MFLMTNQAMAVTRTDALELQVRGLRLPSGEILFDHVDFEAASGQLSRKLGLLPTACDTLKSKSQD